ncbi:autotransporter serine protease [Stenotrophomonas sp. YIM B06876]|uniref:autotransporter serine protease n=1 Tax=Stenotrophomonas sp. YIM B06876 TaxID=3060211 RepID=UPI0027389C22|nr:autotransporter serine protease [Stenotrophomonas sp. YIM B06876]
MNKKMRARNLLAASLAAALVGCGGGGGTRPDPVPVSPPPTAPPPTPTPPPVIPQPAFDAHLALTNARAAQAAGLTGAGLRIGVIDSGVNRNHPTLAGRVVANYNYVDPKKNNLGVDDVVGHGTTVAQLAAGAAVGQWPGGIAPGAQIVSARIINDKAPTDDGSGKGNEVTGALGLAPVHQDLINAGVRIMNNSWGGLYWTNASATAPIAAEYRPFIIGNDGLVVFATGNESKANPSDMAALPSQPGPGGTRPAADLERGWLAVAALDTATPTQLAYYSNACGVAMNYCLVAPGTSMFIGPDATAGNLAYFYGSGTSYATPLVSGAAALVWQAFPYFSNDLVRQTLLGTATDLGAAGPDPVFGYGLLNIGKAVNGPGKFDWGDVTVNLAGTSTWNNAITGSGGLIKRGSGTLVLGHAGLYLDYTGSTRIQQGTLVVAGDLHHSNVVVENGGRLAGTAGLGANLANAGIVEIDKAGAAYGGIRIAGDYTQQASGRLDMTLGYGQLLVAGKATLQGGGVHVLGVRDGYVTRAREYVLTADGGLSGQFATLTSAPSVFLEATLGYSPTQAWMDINRLNVTAVAMSLNNISAAALGAASRVEAAFQQIDAQQAGDDAAIADGFIRGAAVLQQTSGNAAAAASLRSLSGEAHAAAAAMAFDSIDMHRRALSSHFDDGAGRATTGGAWARDLGSVGQGSYAGSDFDVGGWMLGTDYRVGASGVAGFAFGQTRANSAAATTALDRGRDRQTHAQAFAGWEQTDNYALGQLGTGHYQRQMDRRLLLGAESYAVASQYGGRFFGASVEAGHRFGNTHAGLTPYLGAEYTRIDTAGFSEQGGYGFGLRSDASTATRTQALAGVRGRYRWQRLALNGYAEWQQALTSDGLMLAASFVGVDAWAPLAGMQPARSGGLLGVSLDSWLTGNTQLAFGYDQRFGPRGDNRQWALRYRYAF